MDHPMIYGEPLSFEEIARREGITLEQAKWEYRKGMSKLKHRPGVLDNMRRLAAELHPGPYCVNPQGARGRTARGSYIRNSSIMTGGAGPLMHSVSHQG